MIVPGVGAEEGSGGNVDERREGGLTPTERQAAVDRLEVPDQRQVARGAGRGGNLLVHGSAQEISFKKRPVV